MVGLWEEGKKQELKKEEFGMLVGFVDGVVKWVEHGVQN